MTVKHLTTLKVLDDKWIPWAQWKEAWESADNIPACEGLLHSGFRTEVETAEEASERLQFYLNMADANWTARPIFNSDTYLRGKAFKVLALLEGTWDDYFRKGLLGLTPETAEVVFRFFRPKGGFSLTSESAEGLGLASFQTPTLDRPEIGNHAARKFNEKLLNFCDWVWRKEYEYVPQYSSDGRWPRNPATIEVLNKRRVDIIDILHAYGNGKLENLVNVVWTYDNSEMDNPKGVYRVQWELFTPECIERLYELASRKSAIVGPTTVGERAEDALVRGSTAAKVLTLVNAAQRKLGLQK